MKVARIQFVPWDKSYYFTYGDLDVRPGDRVIVKTEMGIEMGTIIGLSDVGEKELGKLKKMQNDESSGENGESNGNTPDGGEEAELQDGDVTVKPILRRANASDLEKLPSADEKARALEYVRQAKKKYGLPMKFIDVYFSFDSSRITFAFIADGRVDFREMVKDLTRYFGKTIRLQQIGIRDEAKIMGDVGHCGRCLCCRGHLTQLESITSEMAEAQQCSHRGSDRISGVCGRLMCCLAYEQGGYESLATKFPPIGTKVNVDGKRGTIVGYHTLKQSVSVELINDNGESGAVIEVDLNRKKKNNK